MRSSLGDAGDALFGHWATAPRRVARMIKKNTVPGVRKSGDLLRFEEKWHRNWRLEQR